MRLRSGVLIMLALAGGACGRSDGAGGEPEAEKAAESPAMEAAESPAMEAAESPAMEAAESPAMEAGESHTMEEYAPISGDAAIKEVTLGTSDSDQFDPSRTGTQFPEGTDRVFVWYRWDDAETGTQVGIHWSLDGTVVLEQGEPLTEESGTAAWFLKMGAGGPLPPGSYQVELLENDTVVTTIPFRVGRTAKEE